MNFEHELDVYVRARVTLIVAVSREEERLLTTITKLCERRGWSCVAWDTADQFHALTSYQGSLLAAKDAVAALDAIEKGSDDTVFVLKDFHEIWEKGPAKRKLRNVAQRLKSMRKSIIIASPIYKLPDDLRDEAAILEFPPPAATELETILQKLVKSNEIKVRLTKLGREKLVQAALGLTGAQAKRCFAKAIVEDGVLDDRDIDRVTQEKRQIIRENPALEFFATTSSSEDVGGLDVLKAWLRLRERGFTQEAREYGLPFPKGVALIGIPGTGKSLTAKMIAGSWHQPLLRLDVGALFGSLVGESEERTRQALRLAETVAPCVLWIDEMEKALAHGDLDGGTSTRVFGHILTWMQEKSAPCFVVATANDISRLPPELLRKGRFDEIFFLDLPTDCERRSIISLHLRKRRRLPADYDVERLVHESEGYVGAEIEQAIIEAMYLAFNENREFTTEDISASLHRLVPLSVAQREVVSILRNWLRDGRVQSASSTSNPGEHAELSSQPIDSSR